VNELNGGPTKKKCVATSFEYQGEPKDSARALHLPSISFARFRGFVTFKGDYSKNKAPILGSPYLSWV